MALLDYLFVFCYVWFVLRRPGFGSRPLITIVRWLQHLLYIRVFNEAAGPPELKPHSFRLQSNPLWWIIVHFFGKLFFAVKPNLPRCPLSRFHFSLANKSAERWIVAPSLCFLLEMASFSASKLVFIIKSKARHLKGKYCASTQHHYYYYYREYCVPDAILYRESADFRSLNSCRSLNLQH